MEDLTATNSELKRLVNSLLDGLDAQSADIPDICERLSKSQCSGYSEDKLVEITVDAYGVVIDTKLAAQALQSRSREHLAQSITQAARAAAAAAEQQRTEIISPLTATVEGLPDLSDLFPGAPSLREIRGIIGMATTPETIRRDHDSHPADLR
ncbi:YbaB/EbfC family nucleoid-associated protein [Nocardia sp. NPDC058058]|uniref:YbaB/EbfC family nucleoid-associated protein n=1 Tax=Nocardia sp. NPDC058058 TaxID=3346317 RepID=UPI0036DE4261